MSPFIERRTLLRGLGASLALLGKGQGRLQTGRHLACDEGTPLANLHLTLAQQFGVEIDSFNKASTGTIEGIFV